MPHKCMDCKNLIESGAIDLQKGCPICGGKKFQYIRPRVPPERKPTVAEYVAAAALREPQAEAQGPPIAGRPEKRPPKPAAQEQPAAVPAALKKPEARPARKSPQDRLGERVESIRVVEQGTYDINLPLLLNREELIMSKGEGSYIVDLNSVLKSRRKKKKKR